MRITLKPVFKIGRLASSCSTVSFASQLNSITVPIATTTAFSNNTNHFPIATTTALSNNTNHFPITTTTTPSNSTYQIPITTTTTTTSPSNSTNHIPTTTTTTSATPSNSKTDSMPPSSNSSNCPDSPRRRGKSRQHSVSAGRMGMRNWLEDLLNTRQCHGLEWKDKLRKIFTIVWRHASSHGFDQNKHADVFLQWARYRGRPAETSGKKQKKQGTCKYNSTCKATFRCALQSLIDCIEIPNSPKKKKDSPKKTFQFISPSHPQYKVKRDKKRRTYQKTLKSATMGSTSSDTLKLEENEDLKRANISTLEFKVEEECKYSTELNTPVTGQESVHDEASSSEEKILTAPPLNVPASHLTYEIGPNGQPSFTIWTGNNPQREMKFDLHSIEPGPSSLPDFKALGVKDQYEPMRFTNSSQHTSGGSFLLRKTPVEKTDFIAEIVPSLPIPIEVQEVTVVEQAEDNAQELYGLNDEDSNQPGGVENIMHNEEEVTMAGFIFQELMSQSQSEPAAPEHRVITESLHILNDEDLSLSLSVVNEMDYLSDNDLQYCANF